MGAKTYRVVLNAGQRDTILRALTDQRDSLRRAYESSENNPPAGASWADPDGTKQRAHLAKLTRKIARIDSAIREIMEAEDVTPAPRRAWKAGDRVELDGLGTGTVQRLVSDGMVSVLWDRVPDALYNMATNPCTVFGHELRPALPAPVGG